MLSYISNFVYRRRGNKQGKIRPALVHELHSLGSVVHEGNLLFLNSEKTLQETRMCDVYAQPSQTLRCGLVCKKGLFLGEDVEMCFIVFAEQAERRVQPGG